MQEEVCKHYYQEEPAQSTDSDYMFILRRIGQNVDKLQFKADFSYYCKQKSSQNAISQSLKTIPKFNRDQLFYTPSFILQEDIVKLKQKDIQFLSSHQKKINEFFEQKEQIYVPKPTKTNRFCLVCKQKYDDYLTHINQPLHKSLLKASPFYAEINSLCTQKNQMRDSCLKLKKKITKKSQKRQKNKQFPTLNHKTHKIINQNLSTNLQQSPIIKLLLLEKAIIQKK